METIKTALPTHREAKNSLDVLLSRFNDSLPLEETDIKTATLGIANGIQIRDYAMGEIGLALPDTADSLLFIKALEALGTRSAHLIAVKSAYLWESGDSILANLALNEAFKIEPENSLAKLLRRVFSAGWPADSFKTMREELAPKVREVVEQNSEIVVGEE